MTHISEFSGQEAECLMALPYKVGIWISYAEDEAGEDDDRAEEQALLETLKAIASVHEEEDFVQHIINQTLSFKSEWARWRGGAFQTPDEAQKAASLLASKASESEQKAYKAAVLEIARTVAMAHGEFNSFDEEEKTMAGLGQLIGRIVTGFSKPDKSAEAHPMNISAAEEAAIEELKQALEHT